MCTLAWRSCGISGYADKALFAFAVLEEHIAFYFDFNPQPQPTHRPQHDRMADAEVVLRVYAQHGWPHTPPRTVSPGQWAPGVVRTRTVAR